MLLAAVGWFALSNHCALAAIELSAAKAPMHCHGSATENQAPAQDNRGDVECCKVVRATLVTPAEKGASPDQLLFTPFKYLVVLLVWPDAGEQVGLFEWDTGPPPAPSFSEVVLQRSILAHAPPALV